MADIESSYRTALSETLGTDFFVHERWSGHHKHGGELVYYDLVLQPRPHLLEQGFDNGFVVVEVKVFNAADKKKHDTKARDLLWQCVAYSFSDIVLPYGEPCRPLFVLYYIAGDGVNPQYKEEVNDLHHFVQRGGVGRLDVDAKSGWSMIFGGSYYFRSSFGKGRHHVGTKRQTGSSR